MSGPVLDKKKRDEARSASQDAGPGSAAADVTGAPSVAPAAAHRMEPGPAAASGGGAGAGVSPGGMVGGVLRGLGGTSAQAPRVV